MARGTSNDNNGQFKLDTVKKVTLLEADMNEIKNNHLPHINRSIEELTKEVINIKILIARWGGIITAILMLGNVLRDYILKVVG